MLLCFVTSPPSCTFLTRNYDATNFYFYGNFISLLRLDAFISFLDAHVSQQPASTYTLALPPLHIATFKLLLLALRRSFQALNFHRKQAQSASASASSSQCHLKRQRHTIRFPHRLLENLFHAYFSTFVFKLFYCKLVIPVLSTADIDDHASQ